MRQLKPVITFILCLMLMLSLVLSELAFLSSATLFNSKFYAGELSKIGYYSHLKGEIEQGLIDLGMATGLPQEVFANSVDQAWLESEGNRYLASLFAYLTSASPEVNFQLNSKPLVDKLHTNINAFAKSIGVTVTQDVQTAIDNMVNQGVKISENQLAIVNIKNPFLHSARNFTTLISRNKIYLILTDLLLVALLFLINKQNRLQFWNWLSYVFLAGGLFLLLPSLMIILSSVLKRIAIGNSYLKDALAAILGGFFTDVLVSGLLTLVIGLFLLGIGQFQARKQQD